MFKPHSRWLKLAGAALLTAMSAVAHADSYPSRPIELTVPFPPGGATDVQARALGAALGRQLNTDIVVVNKPGVSGTLGPVTMARNAADGYSIGVLPATLYRLPHQQAVSFDTRSDFTYITNITDYTFGLVVAEDAQWKTLEDLLAYAKAHPGKVSYGTIGAGSTGHVSVERLVKAADVDLNFIPYKGAAEQYPALLGGHIDMVADAGFGTVVDSGKARLLATFTRERLDTRTDVPTVAESGYDIVAESSWGIGGPAGMAPEIVETLHQALKEAMKDPVFVNTLTQQNQRLAYMAPEAYKAYAAERLAAEKKFLTELGLAKDN